MSFIRSPNTDRNQVVFSLSQYLSIGCQAMQQLTGIHVISYYLPYVLTESAGLSRLTARLLATVNAITYLDSTFIGLLFIKK